MSEITIKLPVELDISAVADYHSQILLPLIDGASQQSVLIDASDLTHIDSAGIQLLLAIVQHASQQYTTLSWYSIPDVLTQCAAQLGLTDALLFKK